MDILYTRPASGQTALWVWLGYLTWPAVVSDWSPHKKPPVDRYGASYIADGLTASSHLQQERKGWGSADGRDAVLGGRSHNASPPGPLTHDDRVDAATGAVAHFQRAMMIGVNQTAKAMKDP